MNQHDVAFGSTGKKISAILLMPDNPKELNPGLLVIHGWRSTKERYPERIQRIVDSGFIALIPDLPGHGKSEGDISKMTRKDYSEGVVSAYDYLTSLSNIDKNKIGVHGSSFGGYLAVLLAKERSIKWLALKNPANYPDSGEDEPKASVSDTIDEGKWEEQPRNTNQNTALKILNRFEGETLLIQSEKDNIVPKQTFINYINAIPNKAKFTHIVIKDADHRTSDPKWEEEYIKANADWFLGKNVV